MTAHMSPRFTNFLRSKTRARDPRVHHLPSDDSDKVSRDKTSRRGYPLSYTQQSMWFWNQFQPKSPLYNIPLALRIRGPLDVQALQASLNVILGRHEILRTNFISDRGTAMQVVSPERTLHLPVTDIRGWPALEREEKLLQLANDEVRRPFDLSSDLMLRARLMRVSADDNCLVVTMHHIASDGWSVGVFLREMAEIYTAKVSNREPVLPVIPIQYPDFALQQREAIGPQFESELAFWKKRLAENPEYRHLTPDHSRPVHQTFRGAKESIVVPENLFSGVIKLGQLRGASLFMTLMAALQVLLHRYSGHEDIFLAFPAANRNRSELLNQIGFFANTLLFVSTVSGNPTFLEFLERVRDGALDAYGNQDLPFHKLVEELQPSRSLGQPPLYQVMLALENDSMPAIKMPELTVERLEVTTATAKCDLTVLIEKTEKKDEFEIALEYNCDLFDSATMKRMLEHYVTVLQAVVRNPDLRIGDLPILTEAEHRFLVVESNETKRPYPEACIHELFEAQAKRNPDAIAIVFKDEMLTYRELNERADQLAVYLRNIGIRSEMLVGVLLERSPELVIAFLAILKAGGAYSPLDPAYPPKRLSFLIEHAGIETVLTLEKFRKLLPEALSAKVVAIDGPNTNENSKLYANVQAIANSIDAPFPGQDLRSKPTPDNLAYVLHTSGSTGIPKGVEISHRGVIRLLIGQDFFRIHEGDVLLQLAPLSFDTSVIELWGTLLHGARLILFPGKVPTAHQIEALIREHRVTTLGWLTTSLFNLIVDEKPQALATVREILIGGEALSVPHIRRAQALLPDVQLINAYGPTENSVLSTSYLIPTDINEKLASIPIGKPIPNSTAYVLDRYLQPVPVGVLGELYVGGDGLARGYRNQPVQTCERFIPNPFSDTPGEKIYKTGDRARYLPDGNIEYLGRLDHQVKIRGFRIELGEVEANLLEHPQVQAASAAVHQDSNGIKSLLAYIVPLDGQSLTADELRNFLGARFPEYMIPSRFIFLDRLPMLSSGKIDRKALAALEPSEPQEVAHTGPRDSVESELVKIWEDLIERRRVGISDNFYDLGGHSLLAVRLVAEIERAFGRKIDLSVLVSAPTIENLALYLRNADRADCNSVVAMQPQGSQPPLFCVHGGGGHVLRFRDLAQALGTDQPFYGLRAPLFSDYTSQVTVEFLAERYLADIRKVQPHGPYYLAGASFGGLVAYEMACQFRWQGEEVGLVALFDTGNPAFCRSLSQFKALRFRTLRGLERFRYRLWRLSGIVTGREVELAEKLLESARNKITALLWKLGFKTRPLGEQQLPGMLWDNLKLFMRAAEMYRPKPYPGRITLFKAVEQNALYGPDAKLGWGNTALGGVQIIDVPGDHMTLLEKTKVFQLANHLRACMEAAQLEFVAKRQAELAKLNADSAVNAAFMENILPLEQGS